jgi:putative hydrolase of the HAD superfamily
MSEIKNIVFDFGGVIVDTNMAGAINKFKEIGIDAIEEFLDPYRQKGIFRKIEDGSISREEFYVEICRLTGTNIDRKDIDQGWLDFLMPVEQERLDYILTLREKYKLLLLSNTNDIIMSWATSEKFSPAGKPLDYYFDELYVSYKMGCMKPDAEIFNKMIRSAQINPSETFFIDDSDANITTAKKLGFKTFWFKKENSFSEINDKIAYYYGKV